MGAVKAAAIFITKGLNFRPAMRKVHGLRTAELAWLP